MNLKSIFSIMSLNNFYYFNGNTNDKSENLFITFSTLNDCKGDIIELELTNNNCNNLIYNNQKYLNLSDNDLFNFLKSIKK